MGVNEVAIRREQKEDRMELFLQGSFDTLSGKIHHLASLYDEMLQLGLANLERARDTLQFYIYRISELAGYAHLGLPSFLVRGTPNPVLDRPHMRLGRSPPFVSSNPFPAWP